jgi:hypothetical protein
MALLAAQLIAKRQPKSSGAWALNWTWKMPSHPDAVRSRSLVLSRTVEIFFRWLCFLIGPQTPLLGNYGIPLDQRILVSTRVTTLAG